MSAREFDPHDPNPPRVPDFRGGPSAWLIFLVGPLLGALVTAAGAVWVIARMPDGGQFHEMSRDVSAVKLDVAVLKANQESAIESTKEIKSQLKTLIEQRRK
jgi:hypothetical protein